MRYSVIHARRPMQITVNHSGLCKKQHFNFTCQKRKDYFIMVNQFKTVRDCYRNKSHQVVSKIINDFIEKGTILQGKPGAKERTACCPSRSCRIREVYQNKQAKCLRRRTSSRLDRAWYLYRRERPISYNNI